MWCWVVLWKTWLLMFPNWEALINCAPSAEAKRACKHLPTIQLSDPRPSGSQPTLCCKKSLLTPSIKATLIFCLKQPTTWTAFMVLITLSPARRRWPQRAKKLYQVSLSVSYHTFILHQGLVTLFGLSALARTYRVQRTRGGGGRVSETRDNGNNCTSNLAPCLSQVCNQIPRTMQGAQWNGDQGAIVFQAN